MDGLQRTDMETNQVSASRREDSALQSQPSTAGVRSEDIFIRNYDPYRVYGLEMRIESEHDTTVFREQFYLRPGQVESLGGVLWPGDYQVTVELDTHSESSQECRVGPAPEETIQVEVGNGIVSLSQGFYG